MDKIVVSTQELAAVNPVIEGPNRLEPKLPPAVPWWWKLAFVPFVLVLPFLSLLTIILRAAIRNQPARIRHAWTAYLSTLLIISGFLTSAAVVLVGSYVPLPSVVSSALSDLDERTIFPSIPSVTPLTGAEVSAKRKPLVAVITPAAHRWFSNQETSSNSFGAGILLQVNSAGYLFATARHVVDGEAWRSTRNSRALVAMASGYWAGADVIAHHRGLDLALLWIPRQSGHAEFVQPIASGVDGESIFVIGHPEGLKFTISTGIVSRMEESVLQISAPISPGNSGGPVFDDKGNLIGIVTSKFDRTLSPNAENLSFAVSADALLRDSGWEFASDGQQHLKEFLKTESQHQGPNPQPSGHASRSTSTR